MAAFQALGRLEEGLANAERVMAMGRESGVTTYGLWARNCAVSCLAELGRLDEARSMMADVSTLIERQDKTLHSIGALRVALAGGDREAALQTGTVALEAIDWPGRCRACHGAARCRDRGAARCR